MTGPSWHPPQSHLLRRYMEAYKNHAHYTFRETPTCSCSSSEPSEGRSPAATKPVPLRTSNQTQRFFRPLENTEPQLFGDLRFLPRKRTPCLMPPMPLMCSSTPPVIPSAQPVLNDHTTQHTTTPLDPVEGAPLPWVEAAPLVQKPAQGCKKTAISYHQFTMFHV